MTNNTVGSTGIKACGDDVRLSLKKAIVDEAGNEQKTFLPSSREFHRTVTYSAIPIGDSNSQRLAKDRTVSKRIETVLTFVQESPDMDPNQQSVFEHLSSMFPVAKNNEGLSEQSVSTFGNSMTFRPPEGYDQDVAELYEDEDWNELMRFFASGKNSLIKKADIQEIDIADRLETSIGTMNEILMTIGTYGNADPSFIQSLIKSNDSIPIHEKQVIFSLVMKQLPNII